MAFRLFSHRNQIYKYSCKILPSISSDHDIIEITMNVDKIKRSPGFWKLSNSLLNDNSYKSEIEKLIEDT